jgi:uncharacterized protein HemX
MSTAPQPQPERNGTLSRPIKLGESLAVIAVPLLTVLGLVFYAGGLDTQIKEHQVTIDRQAHDIEDLRKNKAERSNIEDLNRRLDELDNKLDELKNIMLQQKRR